MLKIKDNVDIKKIKDFYISDDEFDQLWSYKELLFDKDTRIILADQFMFLNGQRLDDLYDLIKDGLVEKID
jgi:hypothetical protein